MNKHAEEIIRIVSINTGVPIDKIVRNTRSKYRDSKGTSIPIARALVFNALHNKFGFCHSEAALEMGVSHWTSVHYCKEYSALHFERRIWRQSMDLANKQIDDYIDSISQISA